MKKISKWIYENALFLLTLFLLVFIPLYPKIPLVDVKNTWVYVRVEDFIVLLVLCIYIYYFIKKKVSFNTPLTLPILVFWILGGVSTIHGVLLFFPTIANVFPNVALLSYIRHIEYMSVFFIAFAGMRRKDFLKTVIAVLSVVFVAVCLYGLGQKYAQFPAFLTMNEEFAKGVPITLSQLSRVPSTFAGHYDFAAYLVLLIPIFAALIFGVKSMLLKAFFAGSILLGLLLMFMTVSRVSFFAVLISIVFVVFILKRKLILFSIPFILLVGILITFTQSSLFARFGNTVQDVDVLVNGKTGAAVGNVEYVPVSYLYGKEVKVQRVDDEDRLDKIMHGDDVEETSSVGATLKELLPYELLPKDALVSLVKASNISTGETLPQGTGYINLSLSPVKTRVGDFYYELSPNVSANEVINFHGNFLVKNAAAYDLSFTTRFQGEWPNAISAFMKNVFLGSGYGSVSLAIDNNFLRMLAEVGLLGTVSFVLLFVIVGIYTYKSYKYIESKLTKTFVIGVCAGIIGLALNAVLIDVYEASKVAFILWMIIGITLAVLVSESSKKINLKSELLSFAVSPFAAVVYLGALCMFLYTPIINQFFTLKDFNVFFHSVSCGTLNQCFSAQSASSYLFGVPGVEPPLVSLYFFLMHKYFWLNQAVYHMGSVLLNFFMALLVFVFAKKLFKKTLLSLFAGFIFLISASTFQAASSIHVIGVMSSSLFALLGVLLYMEGQDRNRFLLKFGAVAAVIISLLFGPIGLVTPLLIIAYRLLLKSKKDQKYISYSFLFVLFPSAVFIIGRFVGMFILESFSIMDFGGLAWIISANTLMSIPTVILGESMSNILIRLYSLPAYMQIVLSFTIILFMSLVMYTGLKKKFFKNDTVRFLTFLLTFFVLAQLPFSIQKDIYAQSVYFSIAAWCMLLTCMTYGLYRYLRRGDALTGAGFIVVFVITYSLFQIIQIQGIFKNNHTSSESVKKFLVSIDSLYSNNWADKEVNFYFLNTPSDFLESTQSQSSLESVLWFIFQNPYLDAHILDDINMARNNARQADNSYIFRFNDDRTVSEIPKYVEENQ